MNTANINKVPWFMAVVNSSLLNPPPGLLGKAGSIANNFPFVLSSKVIPEEVSSNKPINYTEKAVPGGRTSIPQFANFSATDVSFKVTHANFNSDLGVVGVQKFFELLRNPETSLGAGTINAVTGVANPPFIPNPRVLYFYGTGSVPMLYFVTNCSFKLRNPNRNGFPQVIEVSLDLKLDEQGVLFKLEEAFRQTVNVIGLVGGQGISLPSQSPTNNPYYTPGGVIPGQDQFFG